MAGLFPDAAPVDTESETAGFPVIEPTLIPITDGGRTRAPLAAGDKTPVAAPRVYVTPGPRPAPAPDVPPFEATPPQGTEMPTLAGSPPRRTKTRARPR